MPDTFPVRGVLFFSMVLGTAAAPVAQAALSTADQVVLYDAANDSYSNATAALGLPNPIVDYWGGSDFNEPQYLTPFNAAYDTASLAGVSGGGTLELRMSSPIRTDGFTLGIHAGVGLTDTSYPYGVVGSPAATYSSDRQATVQVSSDGTNWVSLGAILFDLPTNYYSQGITTPASATTPGTALADFSKPFTGTLDDFSGRDWTAVLNLLDGSAGGTWLDLSATGLDEVSYVKFDVADGQRMLVDSVVGIAVPEPSTAILLLLPAAVGLLHRRRAV